MEPIVESFFKENVTEIDVNDIIDDDVWITAFFNAAKNIASLLAEASLLADQEREILSLNDTIRDSVIEDVIYFEKKLYARLKEPLGSEFEKVLYKNLSDLYARS